MDPPSRAILVLDGGFTALSQLLILAEIWRRLRYDLKREIPAPFAVFNLIVGSGAGGVVAILLGRMKLSIEDAIQRYLDLGREESLIQNLDKRNRSRNLENAIHRAIRNHHAENFKLNAGSEYGNCCITTADPRNLGHTCLLRTYLSDTEEPSITLGTALRITGTTFQSHKSVFVAQSCHSHQIFVDGSSSLPNPIHLALGEVKRLYGRDMTNAVIISLGAGRESILSVDPTPSNHLTFQRMSVSAEETSNSVEQSFYESGIFFRLGVQRGLEDLHHHGGAWQNHTEASTSAYLNETNVNHLIDGVVALLRDRVPPLEAIAALAQVDPTSQLQEASVTLINPEIGKETLKPHFPPNVMRQHGNKTRTRRARTLTAPCLPPHIMRCGKERSSAFIYRHAAAIWKELPPAWWLVDPTKFGFPFYVVVLARLGTRVDTRLFWASG